MSLHWAPSTWCTLEMGPINKFSIIDFFRYLLFAYKNHLIYQSSDKKIYSLCSTKLSFQPQTLPPKRVSLAYNVGPIARPPPQSSQWFVLIHRPYPLQDHLHPLRSSPSRSLRSSLLIILRQVGEPALAPWFARHGRHGAVVSRWCSLATSTSLFFSTTPPYLLSANSLASSSLPHRGQVPREEAVLVA